MDTKKDIGQFFKDNLNQMDFTPNDKGWDKIEEELQQKKKKRRAFFWLFFTSFLAGSIFTLLIGYSTDWFDFGFGKQTKSNQIESNSNLKINTNSNTNSNTNLNSNPNQENSNKNNTINSIEEKNSQETSLTNNQINSNSINNEFENTSVSRKTGAHKSYRNNNISDSKNSNFKSKKLKNNSKNKFSKGKNKYNSTSYKKLLAHNKQYKSNQKKGKSNTQNSNLKDLENNNLNSSENTQLTQNKSRLDSTNIIVAEVICSDSLEIAENCVKPNKKPETKQEKDTSKVITKEKKSAFIVSPYYGVALFNKNQVKGNFKEAQNFTVNNEHYGLMIRWMTSQNYGLQIGVGVINASSKTEIEKMNSNSVIFNDVDNNSGATFPPSNKLIMHHDLRLYEIPLEFYYKLLDKKIGLALSSGVSHTIIKDNTVYIESPDERTKIGKLESISNQSFSANLKFYGFYKFSDKIQFEIYPSFQYQFLNAFRSNDLSPTIFSIRAGITYQF